MLGHNKKGMYKARLENLDQNSQFCDSLKKFVGKQQSILFVHMSYIKVKIGEEETKGQDMRNSNPGQISSHLDNTQGRMLS